MGIEAAVLQKTKLLRCQLHFTESFKEEVEVVEEHTHITSLHSTCRFESSEASYGFPQYCSQLWEYLYSVASPHTYTQACNRVSNYSRY